jgi:hypothetical protein
MTRTSTEYGRRVRRRLIFVTTIVLIQVILSVVVLGLASAGPLYWGKIHWFAFAAWAFSLANGIMFVASVRRPVLDTEGLR